MLIVENDLGFARFLLDVAREKGFKGLVTSLGAAALAMTREYKPDAITLDIFLPDIDGWRVLDRLKNDVSTRHIPVCIISTDDSRERALSSGALAFVAKPIQNKDTLEILLDRLRDFITRPMKSLLLVEPDPKRRERILECIDAEDIQVTSVSDGRAALQMLQERRIDCMIVPPRLPDLTPTALADELEQQSGVSPVPVIVYGDGQLVHDDDGGWKRFGEFCAVRRVHSHGTAAGPDDLSAAPQPDQAAGSQAADAAGTAPVRQGAARQEVHDRGRRHPQHLRPDHRPGRT